MKVQLFHSIQEIDQSDWVNLEEKNFPFTSYSFLESLETSNSTGKRTGWFPLIASVWDNKSLVGASVLYVKTNSYGEYIFDWAWAEAWKKSGLQYYPKLTAAIPFTPATGPKILCSDSQDKNKIASLVLGEIKSFAQKENMSTIHFLFLPKDELAIFENEGFTIRKSYQFHWVNNSYKIFDDFLMALKQKKRKEIRRERKLLDSHKLDIRQVSGKEIKQYAELMYDFYLATIDKKWSCDYLTKEFFKKIFSSMQDEIVLFMAFQNDTPIAATLNFKKGTSLFGRYWGCTKEVPNLHFELCYYQPIEYAIENGLTLFEAGAQGEHKIQRGFVPSYTYSAHLLPEHELGDAVKDYIKREAGQIEKLINQGHEMAYK